MTDKDLEGAYAHWLGDAQVPHAHPELAEALDGLFGLGPDEGHVRRAVQRVREALAELQGQVISYATLPSTPVGPVHVAVGAQGLVAVDMGVEEQAFRAALEERFSGVVEHSSEATAQARGEIEAYFQGRLDHFSLSLDLSGVTEFQRAVLQAAMGVPPGQVASYGEIARRIGRPRSARAVGQALARNPIPIVIPCHRILAADGSLRGYSGGGGVRTKAQLLRLEGALAA
jgi:methylated-DNA-[protein]-cysteine S-methyltransferase